MKAIIRELALQMGTHPRTIQKWKERGGVPYSKQRKMRELSKKLGKRIVWTDLEWPTKDAA